jgi:hypothetical protein
MSHRPIPLRKSGVKPGRRYWKWSFGVGATLYVIVVLVLLVLDLVKGEFGLSGDLLVFTEFFVYWILLTAALQGVLWIAALGSSAFTRIRRRAARP